MQQVNQIIDLDFLAEEQRELECPVPPVHPAVEALHVLVYTLQLLAEHSILPVHWLLGWLDQDSHFPQVLDDITFITGHSLWVEYVRSWTTF